MLLKGCRLSQYGRAGIAPGMTLIVFLVVKKQNTLQGELQNVNGKDAFWS